MSSYLNFYILPKEENKENKEKKEKPILFISFSRSNYIYSEFVECMNIACYGNEELYTEININQVERIINDLNEVISSTVKRLEKMQRYVGGNLELIDDILDIEEHLDELKDTRSKLYFICYMFINVRIYCNIN